MPKSINTSRNNIKSNGLFLSLCLEQVLKKVVGVFVLTLAIRYACTFRLGRLLRLTQRHRQLSSAPVRKQSDKNKPFDFILFLDVLILLGMGITMVLSASSPMSLSSTSSSYTYAYKQAIAAGLGLFVMYVISKIDYKILAKFYKPIWVISIVGLAAVLIPGIGVNVNGALRLDKFPGFWNNTAIRDYKTWVNNLFCSISYNT